MTQSSNTAVSAGNLASARPRSERSLSGVWNIYEITGDKIAAATLVRQRTDPQTAQFIKWIQSRPR